MDEWKVGDQVVLNSGGPYMTIDRVEADGELNCVWLDDAGEHHAAFPAACLTRAQSVTQP